MLVVMQESRQDEQETEGNDLEGHLLPLTEQPKRVKDLAYVGDGMILPSPKGIEALSLQSFKCDTLHRAGAQHENSDGLLRGPPNSTRLVILSREKFDEMELQVLAHA